MEHFPLVPRLYGCVEAHGKDGMNMKKMTVLILALLLMMSTAMADTRITVSGTGETQVSADTAIISLGVSARDRDVLRAQQQVNAKIAAIRKALTDQGVKEENINTDYLNIYATYDYSSDQEQIEAYNANSTLAIRVTDLDSVGGLIEGGELSLFDDHEKKEKLYDAIDKLKGRFGENILTRAALTRPKEES